MREAVKDHYAKHIVENQPNPFKMWKPMKVVLEEQLGILQCLVIEQERRQITDKEKNIFYIK